MDKWISPPSRSFFVIWRMPGIGRTAPDNSLGQSAGRVFRNLID
jgi:hypothetical protein